MTDYTNEKAVELRFSYSKIKAISKIINKKINKLMLIRKPIRVTL